MEFRHLRARLKAIPQILERIKIDVPEDWQAKNSAYSLLLSYGVIKPGVLRHIEEARVNSWYRNTNEFSDAPLTFIEATTWNTWFEAYPEKVCGKEVLTTSMAFPVSIAGSKEEIIKTIRAGLKPAPAPDKAKRLLIMKLKAKAILILQQQEQETSGLSGLGFLGTVGRLGLSGLGKLTSQTSETIDQNAEIINAILDNQEKGKRYSKGDLISFDDILAAYNPGLTKEEIQAWVWYKRSIGVPMTGWEKYYVGKKKLDFQPYVFTKGSYHPDGKNFEIRDNHFRVIGSVTRNVQIGVATNRKLQYDKNTSYRIIKLANDVIEDFPAGSLVYVNEQDIVVQKLADDTDDETLKRMVENSALLYCNGRLMPYPIYAYGNMYDRELQLNIDQDIIREKFGERAVLTQRHIISAAKPRLISIQNADVRERPKILAISDFAADFIIYTLNEDISIDLQKIAGQQANVYPRNNAQRAAKADWEARRDENGHFRFNLVDAFKFWMASLPRIDFKEVTAQDIAYYYLDGHPVSAKLSDEQKDTLGKYTQSEGEELFSRFLNEALTYEDKQKIDFSWNRVFNAWSSVPHHRVPVGFSCSAFFKRSLLQFTPAQRESIAFMEVAGSGCLAYDVGVGKTISAIITLANSLTSGKCKRPLIAVPNPTYAKWLREIIGYTDASSGEFVPGVLSYTGITVNDWSNLGVDVLKKLDLKVSDKTITVVTYEGFAKIGYSEKVMNTLFDELSAILSQGKDDKKSARNKAKSSEEWREMLGTGNRGTLIDIDAMGFDYLVIDEAHNFKNIFDQVPTDEEGRKRFKISGSQSARGIKAFFLANYIQRTFGQNVMLLTATPFTNSPLEIYSMLSLIGYDSLKTMGITSLETFCETFVLQSLEYVNSYTGEIKLDYVVKSYNNRLVLQRLIHNHIAYKTGEEAGVKRPVKINLPLVVTQQADGSTKRLPNSEQIVTYLKPTQNQRDNQERIEALARSGGPKALAQIGKALGQNLDNALSPYLYEFNADTQPTYEEFVENSPKILYAVRCIESVKKWHDARKEPVSGQVIYMNRGKQYFGLIKEYLNKVVGYKRAVKFNGKTFDEVEFITSEVTADRKEAIKDAFLAGAVKIIIGTASIKEGIDLQENGTVLYNLYPDWNPTDIKQLEGRIWRQGNKFGYVRSVMPLVENSMDVFVFQKLEEKTSRINDIWYRADRGNVLDQASLDPSEIKFALFSDIGELLKIKIDQIRRELNRRHAVVKANIEALTKFGVIKSAYVNYQNYCRQNIGLMISGLSGLVDNWNDYKAEEFRRWDYIREMDEKKQKETLADLIDWIRMAQDWQATADLADKEMLRLSERGLYLIEKVQGNGASIYQRFVSQLSEFRQRVSEVRKTERTILIPRGMTMTDDISVLMAEYTAEKAEIEREAGEVSSQEYQRAVMEDIRRVKENASVPGAGTEQRAEQFATLNYLLGYKAADVPADAHGLPDQEKAAKPGNAGQSDPSSDKAKRLKILKLKAKAILILQEQEAETSYRQAA